MLRVLLLLILGISMVAQADIYKCAEKGQVHFQDKPCLSQSEKVDIKLHQPSKDDIDQQKQRTAAYKEDARIQEILTLKKKNIALQRQIDDLAVENKAKYEALQQQTYDVGNGMVATRDPTVLENMRVVLQQHLQEIKHLQQEIENNKNHIQTLSAQR